MNHRIGLLGVISLTALMGLSNGVAQAQTFAAGNLVTYRVGDGSAALGSTGTAIFLDEYTVTGTLVQSVAVPTIASGANFALTASGSATSEGELNVSSNGQYLSFAGYNATTGTTGVASSSTIARGIGIVGNGAIDTSTSFTAGTSFSGNNIRGAFTTDGSSIYAVGGNTGVVNTTKGTVGAGTVVSNTTANLRDVIVANGQLYVSSSSGTTRIATVGTGTPTTTGQTTTNLAGLSSTSPASPYAFFFASLSSTNDTLYVADTNVIDKFSLVGGSYLATGTITGVTGVQGLTGSVTNGTVNLYATIPSGVYAASDASGYNGNASGAAARIAAAGTNTAERGIAFLPQNIAFGTGSAGTPEPGVLPLVAEAGALVFGFGLIRRRKA